MTDPAAIIETDNYESRLCEEMRRRRTARLQANTHSYTPRLNNASAISTCNLQMAYARMRPDAKKPFDTFVQENLEDGRHEEKRVIADMIEEGWDIEQGNVQVDIKDGNGRPILTTRIDGKVRWEGRKVPFEVKRVAPYVFKKILEKGAAALQGTVWTRKYVFQITSYLYAHAEPVGILVASDGCGHRAYVPIFLNLDTMTEILDRCAAVEDSVQSNTLPPPLALFDSDICGRCNWQAICPVERGGVGAEVIVDGEIVELLEERDRTKEASQDYKAADERVKALLKERPRVLVSGKWLVVGSRKERSVSAKPASVSKYWQSKIERMDGHEGA